MSPGLRPGSGGLHGSAVSSANTTDSPAATMSRARNTAPSSTSGASVETTALVGPPRVIHTPGLLTRTNGVVRPNSGRIVIVTSTSTVPSTPSRIRASTDGARRPMSLVWSPGCRGMKSVRATRPVAVRNSVRNTMVSSTYSRRDEAGATGAITHDPPGSPRMRAKNGGESKDGRQAQSMEPLRATSALPRQFESRP